MLWFVLGLTAAGVIILFTVSKHKSLSSLNRQCDESAANILVFQSRRADLLDSLSSLISEYDSSGILPSLLRNVASSERSAVTVSMSEHTAERIDELMTEVDEYTAEHDYFSSNYGYYSVREAVSAVTQDIQNAKRKYNETSGIYNSECSKFLVKPVAKIFGFKIRDTFSI